jgi:hypothetical protein
MVRLFASTSIPDGGECGPGDLLTSLSEGG